MIVDNAIHQLNDSDIAFLGLDYYGTCGEQGFGPSLIRESLNGFSSYDPLTRKDAFNELRICDLGDVKSDDFKELSIKVNGLLNNLHSTLIMLGGEHLVSLPVIKQLRPDNIVFLDAHADYFNEFNGRGQSYATVTRRVSELVSNVVVSGVRDLTLTEAKDLEGSNVKLCSMNELLKMKFKGSLYVSVDLDVLDPIYCPEVSTPIPMGWSLTDLVKVLNKICINNDLLGLDVVELTAKEKGLSSVNAGGIIMNYLKRRCR